MLPKERQLVEESRPTPNSQLFHCNSPLPWQQSSPMATVLSLGNSPLPSAALPYLSSRAKRGICGAPFGCPKCNG
jgi:hypothetical protein